MDNVTLIRLVSGVLALIALPLYFLPAFLARKKSQFVPILLLDIFLGWTVFGWIGALIWAVAAKSKELDPSNAILCPHCGKYTEPRSKYCHNCGQAFLPSVAVQG